MSLISILTKRINWFHDAFQQALEANDGPSLTRAEALVIANMAAGETKASNIARNLGVSRQAVSQILAELSQRDIIVVTENPEDRRSRVARLKQDLDDEEDLCARIFKALEAELEGRIGARRMKAFHEALEGAWGEPPILKALPASTQQNAPKQPGSTKASSSKRVKAEALEG
ncbi:MarR family transcriptional regulator [Sphingobium sp. JS3065]|uniref:MarR family winged helix-turn-helix transcriptional regulator n=1 Tax=Sphingobium sp. JS3065 TaxID=2970925 RepID=UPI0022647906|nr:MarR family transcriptional regulator [Sphingobium sp. JS3065]UZW57462.1 MarR family transcriptional regulator [Sphingobium sp. JS3065]